MAQTYGFCADSACAPQSQAGGEQGNGLVPSVLCSLTSRRCPGHGQTGTGKKWPLLDAVWVAFETVSLLIHVGKGVCGFKTAFKPAGEPGWPVAPGMSRCRLCLGKRRRRGSPFPGLPENSSFHLSLPGKFQPSQQRRGRSCRDGSCDPQPAWGHGQRGHVWLGAAAHSARAVSPHEPSPAPGKTPWGLHSLHGPALLGPNSAQRSGDSLALLH